MTEPKKDPLMEFFQRNQAYAKPGPYATQLNPESEAKFRQWVTAKKIPFDPNAKITDYDLRGFWRALQLLDPRAITAINPNDQKMHFPDYWKTPYHESFSNESQWAIADKAPKWNALDQLVMPDGKVIFDEKAKAAAAQKTKPWDLQDNTLFLGPK